jgi:hypothetical protein
MSLKYKIQTKQSFVLSRKLFNDLSMYILYRRMVRRLMNDDLERIWKEVVVACPRYYHDIRLKVTT